MVNTWSTAGNMHSNYTPTFITNKISPAGTASILRRVSAISVCPECSDVVATTPVPLRCEFCDAEHWGSLALHNAFIANEEMAVVVQEGKCPCCGCHNADRKSAVVHCAKCGEDIVLYLPVYRDEVAYTVTYEVGGVSTSAGTTWLPYSTTATVPSYMATTTAGAVYTTITP